MQRASFPVTYMPVNNLVRASTWLQLTVNSKPEANGCSSSNYNQMHYVGFPNRRLWFPIVIMNLIGIWHLRCCRSLSTADGSWSLTHVSFQRPLHLQHHDPLTEPSLTNILSPSRLRSWHSSVSLYMLLLGSCLWNVLATFTIKKHVNVQNVTYVEKRRRIGWRLLTGSSFTSSHAHAAAQWPSCRPQRRRVLEHTVLESSSFLSKDILR